MIIKYNNASSVKNKLLSLFSLLWEESKQERILLVLEHLLSRNWSPIPPHAKQLKWHDLYEIRIKFISDLYRIHYFVDNNYMVILNWYVKPDWISCNDRYNKSKKNRLDQQIQLYICEALEMKKNYFSNKQDYELFN